MNQPRIDILLATFNGAAYLAEQLASIEAQDWENWRVLVRDDGSTDETPRILSEWSARHAKQVEILDGGAGGAGPAQNFAALLGASDADYFQFCDQDDVWLPSKTRTLFEAVRSAENCASAIKPLLAHSDMVITKTDLSALHASFWSAHRMEPVRLSLPGPLLVRNGVTGCAMMGNAALRRAALPIPKAALMHDWWMALVASHLGGIEIVRDPLVRYRRHGANATGSRARLAPLRLLSETRAYVVQMTHQAAELLARLDGGSDPIDIARCKELAMLKSASFWHRKTFLARHGLWTESPIRNLGYLLTF